MKKSFTLLLATLLTAWLFAAPQTRLSVLQPNAEASLTARQQQAIRLVKHDLSKRASTHAPATTFAPSAQLAVPTAHKAASEVITLTSDAFLVGPEYEAASGEWYIALEAQGYTFRLCWYGDEDDFSGTYTFDDMSMDYTWGWYQSSSQFYEIYLADITMTISQQQVGCLQLITLDATILDIDDRTYQLHAEHSTYTPKTTIQTSLSNSTVTMDFGYFLLQGANSDMSVTLGVISDIIEGEYTHANFDPNFTSITYNGVKQQLLQANLLVYLAELSDGSLGYQAALHFINQDTVLHQVNMFVPLPPAKDTILVECHNLFVDESFADYGFMMVGGSNADYDVFAMYEDFAPAEGVYDNIALTITDKLTWLDATSIRGSLTLTETADGWKANIQAYCDDYNYYSIYLDFQVPVPTDTVTVTFPTNAQASFRPDQLNMLQLIQYAEDYEASITIYNTGLDESFSVDNVILDYTEFYDWTIESSVEIADVKGHLSQRGDTTFIHANYIGFNAVLYDVEFWYTVPTPVDTVQIEMPVKFSNYLQDGYYVLSAYTPDSSMFISLSPLTDQVAGTFVNDGLFGKFGAEDGRYDFFNGNTFIYIESEWQNYTIEKGQLDVKHAADGTITAEAKFIARNGVYYHVKMTSFYNNHLDYDEPEEMIDRVYTTDDNVTIEDQTENNGYIYLALTAADGSDMAAFFFFAEETDEDIVVPVGVYPIDSSEEYGTVYANPGVQGDGVWPSYYARLLDGTDIVIPLWLLVGGTVEVSKDEEGRARLEVNAVNSYGVSVHILYDATDTALQDVPSASSLATKRLQDGRMVIIRNGEAYSLTGQSIAR